jgi:hypothetical protein
LGRREQENEENEKKESVAALGEVESETRRFLDWFHNPFGFIIHNSFVHSILL